MSAKVMVLAEHFGGSLKEISLELLGMAHQVADGGAVQALLLGHDVAGVADELAAKGAGEVVYAESPALAEYTSDGYRQAIEAAIDSESPDIVLFGNTPNGWDVAPLIAARRGVPLASGCSAVSLGGDGSASFTRKAFNGKFVHKVSVTGAAPLLATIDKGAAQPPESPAAGTVRKLDVSVDEGSLRTRYVETKKGASGGIDLTQASIIVSVGRGIGDPEKLDVVRALADALGGQLGASRAVTDAGWLPHEHQIGSSGVTVTPKLYIACGISGAIQHVVGMKGSGYVVAINKDGDAPIFGVADVGVVGDLFEIVPALAKAAAEAKG